MEKRKAKGGWSVRLIAALIFTGVGILYILIGRVVQGDNINGNAIVFRLIFGGLGAVLLAVGMICLFLEIQSRRRNTRLLNSGKYILAEISEITMNYAVSVNSRHPYIVKCQYQDGNGYVHVFKSRSLNFDPSPHLRDQMVRVYVDGEDFKHYYVDIDSVLPTVIEH